MDLQVVVLAVSLVAILYVDLEAMGLIRGT